MKIRKKCPQKNNKYYNNRSHGGLSDAVNGYPMIPGLTVLDNCVGYANSRFNEIINDPDLEYIVKPFKYQLVCNAENFIESAKRQGLKISATPIEGGIMVWQKGRTLGGGDGAGHVAVVEEVYKDGTILTSESGYAAWTFKTIRRPNTNGRWGQSSAYKFRGCIVNPSIKNPKVVPVPPLAVDGVGGPDTVRATQRFLGTPQDGVISGQNKALKKYYPALEAVEFGKGGSTCVRYLQKWLGVAQDGVLGKETIKRWQYVIGVDDDGVFGEGSMRAWQKYLNSHDKAVYTTVKTSTKTSTSKGKKIANQAIAFCGPKNTEKAAYKTAARSVYGKGSDFDCHRFVGTVLRKAGYPKMPIGSWSKILNYLKKNFTQVSVNGTRKAGDIGVYKNSKGGYHIWIELGDGKKAEANHTKKYYPHQATSKFKKHSKDWLFRAK